MNFADPGPRRTASFLLLLLPLLLAAQPVATDGYLPALPELARDLGSASSSLPVFMLAFGVAQPATHLQAAGRLSIPLPFRAASLAIPRTLHESIDV